MKSMRIEITNGLLLFTSLGGYFLILEALGLTDVIYLRIFNAAIVLIFMNRTIRQKLSQGQDQYLQNLGASITTSFVGVILSVLGLMFFLAFITGPEHIQELATSVIVMKHDVSLMQYCLALLVEGLASSMILSFILMQYYKSVELFEHA